MAIGNQRIKDAGIEVLGTAFDRRSGVDHPGSLEARIIYDILETMSIGNKKRILETTNETERKVEHCKHGNAIGNKKLSFERII